ncbi:MAG TPA: CbtB domain-containing protein [Kineosporiaceae bacterium]|nr:CbtB domain-containing protein [Kineosporiaceae bacterium]
MAQTAAVLAPDTTAVVLPVIPIRELLPWAIFAFVIGALLIYFVGAEQGATSVFGGTYVHEFVHDGRHLLGFPCH